MWKNMETRTPTLWEDDLLPIVKLEIALGLQKGNPRENRLSSMCMMKSKFIFIVFLNYKTSMLTAIVP